MYFLKSKALKGLRAFTMVELLIAIGIMGIMVVVTYSGYPKMNSTINYNSAVQDLFDRIKSAQIYGGTAGGEIKGYGIYLNSNQGNEIFVEEFFDKVDPYLFANGVNVSNSYYDRDIVNNYELSVKERLLNSVYVKEICFKSDLASTKDCNYSKEVSIAFVRPKYDAMISGLVNLGSGYTFADNVYITLESKDISDYHKCVIVRKNGQMLIKDDICSLASIN